MLSADTVISVTYEKYIHTWLFIASTEFGDPTGLR